MNMFVVKNRRYWGVYSVWIRLGNYGLARSSDSRAPAHGFAILKVSS